MLLRTTKYDKNLDLRVIEIFVLNLITKKFLLYN